MNPIESIKSVFSNYANFQGRARRSEYWWWALVNSLALFGFFFAAGFLDPNGDEGSLIALALGIIWVLATLLPNISVCVRRFHDSNKTGWLYLLGLIPYIGSLILIVFMILPGTQGENQYGPDPKGMVDKDVFA